MKPMTWINYLPTGKADRKSVQRLSACQRSPVEARMSPTVSRVPFMRANTASRCCLVSGAQATG